MSLFDRLRKKQPIQEEQYQREPYLPQDLEKFRIGESSDVNSPITPPITSFDMPEKERKFKAFAREMETPGNPGFEAVQEKSNPHVKPADKIDMILQKLETIDLRLKFIEEKLERRPI